MEGSNGGRVVITAAVFLWSRGFFAGLLVTRRLICYSIAMHVLWAISAMCKVRVAG